MREIKFRAWNTGTERIAPVITLVTGAYVKVPSFEYGRTEEWDKEVTVLMQYTGLKDKNGKEIYEGDVLQGQDFPTTQVHFNDGGFALTKGAHGEQLLHRWVVSHFEMEIIGNIYENPELLKS